MRKLIAAILSVSTFITAYANLEVHMLSTPVTLVHNSGSYIAHNVDFNTDGIDDFAISISVSGYSQFAGLNNQKFMAEYLNHGGLGYGLAYVCGAQMVAGGQAQTSVGLLHFFDGKGPRYLNLLRFEGNYNGTDHWRFGWAKLDVSNNADQIIFYGWALETDIDVEVLAGQGECISTGISDLNFKKPGIYTADNKIFVGNNDGTTLSIYDLTGRKVYAASALSENDFSFLPSGVYCAVLTGRSKTESIKIYR
ncbi:MAG: T9SS type A sorting domain-containing protein [Chitinophagales bacterium]|nr:T9SS type A sorting domain-containing protein [Chitinophagales bacterium]